MSAIFGACASATRGALAAAETIAARALVPMAGRGHDRMDQWVAPRVRAVLAASRFEWELAADVAGSVLVAGNAECAVVADAALYYKDDLRNALRRAGVTPTGDTPPELILAAYRAWGTACAAHLEGDFAFVIWDDARRTFHAARDHGAKRPLFYAVLDEALVAASTPAGVLAYPGCPHDLNVVSLGETAAGLFAVGEETAYQAVRALLPGWSLTYDARDDAPTARRARLARHWDPPVFADSPPLASRASFEEAAEELRELLARATLERMQTEGPTSIWLSGGWDSPTVYATANAALRSLGDTRRALLPVSMSYPPGDPGREDELIADIAAFWGAEPRWVDIANVPLFDRPLERAATRDDPLAHNYETFTRALTRATRETGARVIIDGNGGDQFFFVTEVLLADLLRSGQWQTLAREWRARNGRGFKNFFTWVLQPIVPALALRALGALRGARLYGYLDRRIPPWIDPTFVRRHSLEERERYHTPRGKGLGRAAYEHHWFLTYPIFSRIFSSAFGIALEEGAELRSPLFDRRLIEFAARRPVTERSSGLETKRLLRQAARGLLPDHILAPRASKTGLTTGYFDRSLRANFDTVVAPLLHEPVLADLGIIDAAAYRAAWNTHLRRERDYGGALYFTLQAEMWARSHVSGPARAASAPRVSSPEIHVRSDTDSAAR